MSHLWHIGQPIRVIAQVCPRLSTINGHSAMRSFTTQHKDTEAANCEGACVWHADCRNVRPWDERSSTINCLQRRFWEFGSISNWPHNRRLCVTTPALDLHQQVHPRRRCCCRHCCRCCCCNNRFAKAKNTVSAQTVSGSSSAWSSSPGPPPDSSLSS